MYNKRFCKEPEKIENYEKAAADNFKGWCCHHRLETHTSDGERRTVDITVAELKALDMYWHRPAEELIFLTKSEHISLHKKEKQLSDEIKIKISEASKGKPKSEETKNRISESRKGKKFITSGMKGKHHSAESIQKISDAKKGKRLSQEHIKKIGAARIGKHWYNNGKENKYCFECPDGFVPGMLFTNINKGN